MHIHGQAKTLRLLTDVVNNIDYTMMHFKVWD